MRQPRPPRLPECRRPPRQLSDLELVLPDFRCEFNTADGDCRCIEALEAQHRSDPLFDPAMVLFNSIIKILARADPDSLRHLSFCLQFPNRPDARPRMHRGRLP